MTVRHGYSVIHTAPRPYTWHRTDFYVAPQRELEADLRRFDGFDLLVPCPCGGSRGMMLRSRAACRRCGAAVPFPGPGLEVL
jgi:hypothetical protein